MGNEQAAVMLPEREQDRKQEQEPEPEPEPELEPQSIRVHCSSCLSTSHRPCDWSPPGNLC
jgi:hypothetical protein